MDRQPECPGRCPAKCGDDTPGRVCGAEFCSRRLLLRRRTMPENEGRRHFTESVASATYRLHSRQASRKPTLRGGGSRSYTPSGACSAPGELRSELRRVL